MIIPIITDFDAYDGREIIGNKNYLTYIYNLDTHVSKQETPLRLYDWHKPDKISLNAGVMKFEYTDITVYDDINSVYYDLVTPEPSSIVLCVVLLVMFILKRKKR